MLPDTSRPVRVTRPVFDRHIWEPREKGYRESVGNRSYGEMFDFLKLHLATMVFDGRPFEECIDYFSCADRFDGIEAGTPLPDYRRVAVWTCTGGSEGWYVHVDLVTDDGTRDGKRHQGVFLVKTFAGWEVAHAIAGAIAQLLDA